MFNVLHIYLTKYDHKMYVFLLQLLFYGSFKWLKVKNQTLVQTSDFSILN